MKTSLLCLLLAPAMLWAQSRTDWNKRTEVKQDTIVLSGYVFDAYVCPPCPPGAQCKPCMPNHLTLVEHSFKDPLKVPLENRLRIFTEHPEDFTVGKRYTFTLGRKGTQSFEQEADLISHKP